MWWWLGCGGPKDSAVVPDAPVHTGGGSGAGVRPHSATSPPPTGHTGAGGHTGGPPPVHTGPDRCASPPPAPGLLSFVAVLPFTEEFALDGSGNWFGLLEGPGLYQWSPGQGDPVLAVPYATGEAGGVRFYPDDRRLALADEAGGAIVVFDLGAGSVTPLLGGLPSPNSIGIDAAGDLWIANYGRFLRLRAGATDPEVVVDLPNTDLDGVTFSPDEQRVWFNGDETGDVWAVDLDAAREVVSVTVETTLPLNGAQLDGMTTDECGNLYVLRTDGTLWRYRTDRTLEPLLGSQFSYASAISFGSGVGGWDRGTLYVMDRGTGLYELPIGLEGRPEAHLP